MKWDEFAAAYCETQESTPDQLLSELRERRLSFEPDGFFLCRCALMGSGFFGQHVVLPYGGHSTHKVVPTGAFSPRGIASDQSTVVGVLLMDDLPSVSLG